MFTADSAIVATNAHTWTIASDDIGPYRIITSWSPVRFSPAYGLRGMPHHFETLVISHHDIGDSQSYATEDEARAGHLESLARMRALVETV